MLNAVCYMKDNPAGAHFLPSTIRVAFCLLILIFSFQRIQSGYLNLTYSCFLKSDLEDQLDGLFVRINEPALEPIWLDREKEVRYTFINYLSVMAMVH